MAPGRLDCIGCHELIPPESLLLNEAPGTETARDAMESIRILWRVGPFCSATAQKATGSGQSHFLDIQGLWLAANCGGPCWQLQFVDPGVFFTLIPCRPDFGRRCIFQLFQALNNGVRLVGMQVAQ